MTGQHNGTNGRKASEGNGRFRRVMDGLGREEDLHQAVERLTAHIGERPDDVEALSARGLLYVELGEHRRAVEDYSRVIDLAPGDSHTYFQRARALAELGEHRSAIDDYGIAIRLDPDDHVARYNRGTSSAELGNFDSAIEDFDTAIGLAPNDADPYYNRGVTYAEMGEHLRAVEVPRSAQPWVANMVRTIYQQPSPQEVHAQLERVIAQLQDPFPQVASRLDEAGPDVLAFSSFPLAHWKKIWSNNPLERLNKEIRRRPS